MSPPSSGSSATSTHATRRPGCCATPPRPPSTFQTRQSPPPVPQRPSARTGRSRTPRITAATSPWGKTARASASIPACSPACAASPSTSSRQTGPTRSAKIATVLVSQASQSYSECSLFRRVEQPWFMVAVVPSSLRNARASDSAAWVRPEPAFSSAKPTIRKLA